MWQGASATNRIPHEGQDARALNTTHKGEAGEFRRVCRLVLGSRDDRARLSGAGREDGEQAGGAFCVGTLPVVDPGLRRKLEASSVLDQGDESELHPLQPADVDALNFGPLNMETWRLYAPVQKTSETGVSAPNTEDQNHFGYCSFS